MITNSSGYSTPADPNAVVTSVAISGTITVNDTLTTTTIQAYTVIGNDGIYCKGINGQSFKVQNTANGQKIYAKGLSNTKGTTGDGSLYVSGNFINAFKEFLTEFNKWVEDVRMLGSNAEKAEAMQKKCTNVLNKLTDTSLVASS